MIASRPPTSRLGAVDTACQRNNSLSALGRARCDRNLPIAVDVPALVWLGSPATEHYVAQIAPALLEINRRTGAQLTLISGPNHNASRGLLNQMIRRIPWSAETFAPALAKADVAIAPLDGSPYSHGKGAYKMLHYAAAGLPIIASPVGANDLALQRFQGLGPSTLDGWKVSLSELLNESASRRARRAVHARGAVERYYSFQAWEEQWLAATSIGERHHKP